MTDHAYSPIFSTLCRSLGEDREPSCVVACPHGAAKRVDPNVFFAGRLTTL